jgi:arsenate reductase
MRKVYYLSTCSTCKRIIKELDLKNENFIFQDIKTDRITEDQINQMASMAGSYEALFSRVARKYKALGLKNQELSELDYKNFILQDYTFLKRPVIIIDDQIFIGNDKQTTASVAQELATL